MDCAEEVAELMGAVLGWDEKTRAADESRSAAPEARRHLVEPDRVET